MSTDLVAPATNQPITLGVFNTILALAPTIHASRMFKGIGSAEQAAVVMMKGAELGFPFTAAFENIEMIEGKAALKPQGMMALIHRSKNFDIKVTDQKDGCTVWIRRRDTGFEFQASFTKADAIQAGLVRPGGNYEKYPPDMYRWRAIARCARVACQDVLAGMYLTVELVDEWNEGDVIEGEISEVSHD